MATSGASERKAPSRAALKEETITRVLGPVLPERPHHLHREPQVGNARRSSAPRSPPRPGRPRAPRRAWGSAPRRRPPPATAPRRAPAAAGAARPSRRSADCPVRAASASWITTASPVPQRQTSSSNPSAPELQRPAEGGQRVLRRLGAGAAVAEDEGAAGDRKGSSEGSRRVMLTPMRLGFGEILIVLVVVLLIFGANKIPQLGDALGKGIQNFRKATGGGDDSIDVTPPKGEPGADRRGAADRRAPAAAGAVRVEEGLARATASPLRQEPPRRLPHRPGAACRRPRSPRPVRAGSVGRMWSAISVST